MQVLIPPKTVFEVFESLPEGTLCQVINNILVMSPAPSDTHQKIVGKIFSRLLTFVESKELGEVRIAHYDIYLSRKNVYQPDIIFIAKENVHRIEEKGLNGTPDIVIEVLSPKTAKYDLEDKKEVYERYGVKEYWIVDPFTKHVTFYSLINETFTEVETKDGVIKSRLLNISIKF